MGFDPSLKCPAYLATLKICDKTKQSANRRLYIYIYIYIYICVCVCVCVSLFTNYSSTFNLGLNINFEKDNSWLKFNVFLFLGKLTHQDKRAVKSTIYNRCIAQSAGVVEQTNCISAAGSDSPNEYPDMTLNRLIMRLQLCWSFRKCRVPLYCHHSQIHPGPKW